jgi:hypothetical protein
MKKWILLAAIGMAVTPVLAQNNNTKIVTYIGVVHPIISFSSNEPVYNFKDYYLVGVPIGINVWKRPSLGFSLEFVPYIRSAGGFSKMDNFLFHPGLLFPLGSNWVLATRAAFETSGRYGFTPVFNKTFRKGKYSNYYVAVPLPARFGNGKPSTFTVAVQFGITF